MTTKLNRRDFLRLAGLGGVVFAAGLNPLGRGAMAGAGPIGGDDDFFFVQLSDSHWGFQGPRVNPHAAETLRRAVAAVNRLSVAPDFVVFTGDLTHTTDDPERRRRRMAEFRDIVSDLKVRDVRFLAGEHDASLDAGAAFREYFGSTHYTFDHRGLHCIVLDNVSDPRGQLGDAQLAWLSADLQQLDPDTPIAVFTHRPLFDLYPQWDWATRDGSKAVDLLLAHRNVTVFYGHIHQVHHHQTGHIAHHAAASLIFPLPAPGSVPKRVPTPWDAAHPYRGLGYRTVEAYPRTGAEKLLDRPLSPA